MTKDHSSYADCLRAGMPRVAYANSASNMDYTAQKKWDRNLDEYRALRAEGIQPQTSQPRDVEAAKRISDSTGTAYRAV